MTNSYLNHLVTVSNSIKECSSQVKILRNIAWPYAVKEEFFANKAEKLPQISYPPYDPSGVIKVIAGVKAQLTDQGDIAEAWLLNVAEKIELAARMLKNKGTYDFFDLSAQLYGKPHDILRTGSRSAFELATVFNNLFHNVKDHDLGEPPEACILAGTVADAMKKVVTETFGEHAPEIVLDPELASNALAGREKVSLRPTACFSDKDIDQLIHHELFVHVATSLNGHLQPHFTLLGEGHAGTTKTQEGLAVFAEFITGAIDLDRVRRLSDRVVAIQKAIEGADFMEVYRYYLEMTDSPDQSFESAKRVFRGGIVTGGAPFTKDIVYLEGLIQVHNFLRVAISNHELDYLDLLFVGKMDITDLPVLKHLSDLGAIEKPRFLPPWIKDKRYLLAYLTYSSFLNSVSLEQVDAYYEETIFNYRRSSGH